MTNRFLKLIGTFIFATALCGSLSQAQIGPLPGMGPLPPFAAGPGCAIPVTLGSASGTTLTTSAAINSGDIVIVGVSLNTTNGGTASGVSDGTNTYSKI